MKTNPEEQQASVRLSLPEPVPKIRDNGDAVVELQQDGECVGEVNFSAILGQWFRKLGWGTSRPRIKLVP